MASGDSLVIWGPLSNEPPSSSPATFDTRNQHPVLDFDAAAHEYAVFSSIMPQHYGGNGVDVNLHVAFSSATTGSAVYEVSWERIGEGQQDMDSDGFATATSVAIGAPATAGFVAASTIAFANGAAMDSVAAGEGFRLKVGRNHDHASDGATGDAELRWVELQET